MDHQSGTKAVGSIALEHIALHDKMSGMNDSGAAFPVGSEGNLVDVPLDKSLVSKKDKPRVPRRILHFSDGILEEYSTDEEEEEKETGPKVDPKTLTWMPWIWYYLVATAYKMLNTADACGEKIAWALGITSPKYQYILDEYHRRKREELKEQMEAEMLVEGKKDPEVVIHEPVADTLETDDRDKGRI